MNDAAVRAGEDDRRPVFQRVVVGGGGRGQTGRNQACKQ